MSIFDILKKFNPIIDTRTQEQVTIDKLQCKFIGLLFTASWCGACVNLNKTLPNILKRVNKDEKEDLKIITIRVDNNPSKFAQKYFKFKNMRIDQAQKLQQYLKVKSFPTMLIYNMKGKLVSMNGVEDMTKFREQTIRLWGMM